MNAVSHLSLIPAWHHAAQQIAATYGSRLPTAHSRAAVYASQYQGKRGLMVVDVVASRQRKYVKRVLGHILPAYQARATDDSLQTLARTAPTWLPVGAGEAVTMQQVAQGLLNFGNATILAQTDEDLICLSWAQSVEEFRFTHASEPFVGSVSGVGPALFSYLRMRSGASAIKPDSRVTQALRTCGTPLPARHTDSDILLAAEAIAEIMQIDRLVFDQLLW